MATSEMEIDRLRKIVESLTKQLDKSRHENALLQDQIAMLDDLNKQRQGFNALDAKGEDG